MSLVAFDFDGTLADAEMIDRLGREAGVGDEVAAITGRAMRKEVEYAPSLRKRAALLEGLAHDRVDSAYAEIQLRPGAGDLLRDLHEAGNTVAILSGGFQRGIESALDRAGIAVDTLVANELPAAGDAPDGHLTGEVTGPLVEGRKDDALADICATQGFALQDVTAVGDGANDRPMLEVAGLAVGFDPKPAVEPSCDVTVAGMPALRSVFEAEGLVTR